ncbi:AsmA family protein [Lichenibacterium ramalinae]|uniref:AsmA family protein n=1 Tax=Lichenibacterium ramalinae TaxID=2316527 RepID=A0A4Q2RGA3_9HYPH|nr:AsmA family protein [Lichenibacterium ramalinae]
MGIGCLLDGDFRIVCRQGPFAQGSALQPGRPRTAIAVTALRDSLTVLAILLIGVLTAALVGPYLIDWDAHRALVEHRLSEAAGVPVTVAGSIDLKILPTPRLAFGDVAIGDGKAGRPRLRVGELQAEVSFTALLRGQVQVVDTTLVRPRLELAQAPDGTVDVALPSGRGADRVAVDHMGIREGTLAVALADGRRIVLRDVALDGEATSLRGPFKASGRVGAVPFRLATGVLDGGRFRMKLHVDAAAPRPALDLDGTVEARAPAGSQPGAVGPGFAGTATLTGSLPLDGTPAAVPWSMTGRLVAGRDAASATDLELRAGTDQRALIAGGDASAAYAAGADRPSAALDLHGAALDLDRLAVAPDDGSIAPPKGGDLLRLLARAAGDGAGTMLPVRLAVAARFDTATLSGQTLVGPSLRLGLGPEPDAALAFGVGGPQGARLALDGRVAPGPARPVSGPFGAAPALADPVFRGRADIRSTDLRRTVAWLAPLGPDFAAALAGLPGRSVALSGDAEASGTGVVLRALSLTLDGSAFAGTLSLTRAVGGERGRLFADLTSDALALDRLPDLSGISAAAQGLDLDLALAARAVTVADPALDLAAGRLGPIAAGNLVVKLTRTGTDLRLERLAADLDGGSVTARGSRSPSAAEADLSVSAPHVGPLARAFGDLLPPAVAAALRARAGLLSPLDATLRFEARGAGDALAPTRLALTATAGGTRIEAGLTPGAAGTAADRAATPGRGFGVTLRAEAPDGADLLRQLGLPVTATGLGPARLDGRGHGSVADGVAVSLDGALGAARLGFSGRATVSGGDGHATLASPDLRPVLGGFGATADRALPAEAAGDVSWDVYAIGARDLHLHVADTSASGDLRVDLRSAARGPGGESAPQLRGTLALDRLPASALFALAFGPAAAPAPGVAWSSASFGAPGSLPDSAVALTIATLPLTASLDARQVSLDLATRAHAVSLTGMAGKIGGGSFGGALALRRDPAGATLSGQVSWAGVGFAAGDVSGRFGGRQDVAATGTSPAALVAGLSGTGTLDLAGVMLARTDPTAPAATAAAVAARDAAAERAAGSTDATATDADTLRRDLGERLDRGPLPIGDARVAATLAGGVLRLGPIRTSATAPPSSAAGTEPPTWSAETSVALDLGTLSLTSRAALRSRGSASGGDAGEVVVTRAGPLVGPSRREIDAAGLLGAIQGQAIARAQERIDVMEQDIRERAAFNRQLKAIQADQESARQRAAQEAQARADQARAEAQARAERVKAEAQARADQARAEAQARRAEADRAKADELRVRAEVEAAARAAVERQRDAAPPPPSIIQGDGASSRAIAIPPASGP